MFQSRTLKFNVTRTRCASLDSSNQGAVLPWLGKTSYDFWLHQGLRRLLKVPSNRNRSCLSAS